MPPALSYCHGQDTRLSRPNAPHPACAHLSCLEKEKRGKKIFSKSLAIFFEGCCLNYFSPTDHPGSQGLGIAPTIQNKRRNCRNLVLTYPQLVRKLSYSVCLAGFACTCNHVWQNNFLSLRYFHSGWLLPCVSHFQAYSPIQGKHSSSLT